MGMWVGVRADHTSRSTQTQDVCVLPHVPSTLPGEGTLGTASGNSGVGGLPGWTLLGLGGVKGTCWVSITARPDGRTGPLHWAPGPGLLPQLADSPAQRAHREPRQLWRPQERGSTSGGKGNAAAEVHCGSVGLDEAASHWVLGGGFQALGTGVGAWGASCPGLGAPSIPHKAGTRARDLGAQQSSFCSQKALWKV